MAGSRESKISTHRSLNRRIIWRATYVGQFCCSLTEGHSWGSPNWDFDMPYKHQLKLYISFVPDERLLFFLLRYLTLSYENYCIIHSFQFEANCFGEIFCCFLRAHLLACLVQDLRGIQRGLAWRPRKRVAGPRSTTRGPATIATGILGWPHWTSK